MGGRGTSKVQQSLLEQLRLEITSPTGGRGTRCPIEGEVNEWVSRNNFPNGRSGNLGFRVLSGVPFEVSRNNFPNGRSGNGEVNPWVAENVLRLEITSPTGGRGTQISFYGNNKVAEVSK